MGMVVHERRSAVRVPCRVTVHHLQGNEMRLYQTIEVSEAGCLLRALGGGRPRAGTLIHLDVLLPGQLRELEVAGMVVSEVGLHSDIFALAFGDLTPTARCALRAFVAEAQYAATARAMVRGAGHHMAQTA